MATLDFNNLSTPTNGTRLLGFTSTASGGEVDIAISDLKKAFATVASTGDYDDLSNKPSLASVATSGDYNDLSNKPDLTSVATLEYVTVTQNKTLQESDKNKILHTTGTVNITCPNSLSSGFSCVIMNDDANRTQITVTTGSIRAKAINLESQYGGATVWKNGANWYSVGDLT